MRGESSVICQSVIEKIVRCPRGKYALPRDMHYRHRKNGVCLCSDGSDPMPGSYVPNDIFIDMDRESIEQWIIEVRDQARRKNVMNESRMD
jgi:hypothetical protein